ncbi:MAG: hypothetical protein KC713_03915 [Candidatus Omnitrophica bacterium]|nr:hypothetical protein [Candidatus Omnitrophota bacterium]
MSTNSYAWKKEYKSAKKFMKAGAYEQAIEQIESALASPKLSESNSETLNEMLKESQLKAAEGLFHRGKKYAENNEVSKAAEILERVVSYDPTNAEYKRYLVDVRTKLGGIQQKVNAAYDKGAKDLRWEEGLAELESYRKYESSFPEIAERINAFKDEAAQYFLSQSDGHLVEQKYSPAYQSIEQALRFSDQQGLKQKKKALHHLVMSEEAWKDGRYLKAYEEIMKGLEIQPDQPELGAFQSRLLEEWCGILYNEAVQAQNDGRYAAAKAKLTQLSQYKPGFLNTEDMLLEVSSTLATDSYDKAEQFMNSENREKIGSALAHFLLVQEEHSNLYPDIDQKVDEAKRLLQKELEFRVALDFENSSAEPGAGGLVKEQILNRMKKEKALKHLTILDRESIDDILREQGLGQGFLDETTAVAVKKIKGIQAGIRGEVIKVDVKETGRDRPSYGSSRYVSGKRYVPNPAYQQAQARVQAAQQNVLQAQSDLNRQQQQNNQQMQMNQNSNNQYAGLIAGLGQLGSAFSEGALNGAKRDLSDAQLDLANTPPQIEEDIMSDYRYEIFDLKLQGEVVISLKVINYTTSEISEVHTIRKRKEVTDRYIPGDPGKNVRSDPIELPTMDEFKSTLMNDALEEVFTSLVSELGSAAESYYTAAKKAADMGIEDDAVEYYMRYMYSAPDLGDPKVMEANEYIYDHLGLRILRRAS